MITFVKSYFWFWKESFNFMKGYNPFYIIWGCLKEAHVFAYDMCKWEKMSEHDKEQWYINSDRRF